MLSFIGIHSSPARSALCVSTHSVEVWALQRQCSCCVRKSTNDCAPLGYTLRAGTPVRQRKSVAQKGRSHVDSAIMVLTACVAWVYCRERDTDRGGVRERKKGQKTNKLQRNDSSEFEIELHEMLV